MYYVDFCRAKTGYWVGWTQYNNATFFAAASTLDELVRRMKVKLYNKYRMSASSIIIAEKQSKVEDCPYYLMGATFLKRYWGAENVFNPGEESVCTTVDNPKHIKHKSPKQIKTMQDASLYDRVTYEEQDGKLIVYGIMKIAEYPLANEQKDVK